MRLSIVKETTAHRKMIDGCLKNDRDSQKLLYDTFATSMLVVCMRYTDNKQEAEDILIDGFMSVFTHLSEYNGQCPFDLWIRRIMINKAISHYRNNKRRYDHIPIDETENILVDEIGSEIETVVDAKEIMKIIQEMPESFKVIFNLRVFEEYKFKDIADTLDMPVGTVRVTFLRARNWIEQRLPQY